MENPKGVLLEYARQLIEREANDLPPQPLSLVQTEAVIALLSDGNTGLECIIVKRVIHLNLVELLTSQVAPGLSDSAKPKADFLMKIAKGSVVNIGLVPETAVFFLGTMEGGYCIPHLLALLHNKEMALHAATALSDIVKISDEQLDEVISLSVNGSHHATGLLDSWGSAKWFLNRPALPLSIKVRVYKSATAISTDDLSPGKEAATRTDIPLHAQSMLRSKGEDALPNLLAMVNDDLPVATAANSVWSGSSRKSAIQSYQWNCGDKIPFVPARKSAGIAIAPIFGPIGYNAFRNSGGLPIKADVSNLSMGDVVTIRPYDGVINDDEGKMLSTFTIPAMLADEFRAGGRLNLILGKDLTNRVRAKYGLGNATFFARAKAPTDTGKGYTLMQKLVAKASGLQGVRPGQYVEPKVSTVGSQDTTGRMTMQELIGFCCEEFNKDTFVLQSLCHTAAIDDAKSLETQKTLPKFFEARGGVALRKGDGVIHTLLNRMLVPDQLGTGGDSHTRFPIGVSFPGDSGLVAFAAMTGTMPLEVPESVLVKFSGTLQPGVTLRDAVNSIPYNAIKQGLLVLDDNGEETENVFAGKVLEIQGLPDLEVEQAFELTDYSAEISTDACTIQLDEAPVIRYLESNVVLLQHMIDSGYSGIPALTKRLNEMKDWLANPVLLKADDDAEYHTTLEINLSNITQPIVACPHQPYNVKLLSELSGIKMDEVFTGSCMTNIGHMRAASEILNTVKGDLPVKFWAAPPSRMDRAILDKEGHSEILNISGHLEISGCSLCMGNQKNVDDGATVFSTSTRNFNGRMGKGAQVYLGSPELAAVTAKLGRIPDIEEYFEEIMVLAPKTSEIYRYHDFVANGVPEGGIPAKA